MSILYNAPNGSAALEFEKLLSAGVLKQPITFERNGSSRRYPPLEFRENEDSYYVLMDLPGFDRSEVEVTYENGCLVIAGERTPRVRDEKTKVLQTELSYGRFHREIPLPASADAEQVSAELENGMLVLTIQKIAEAKPRRIKVE